MEKTQPQNRGETFRLLRRFGVFFKGCGAKYLGGILCVVVTVMVSFITPLLVGGTVDAITDSVTGNTGAAVNMPGFLANWFAARGGVVYIAKHVWIVGAMLLGVQLFGGVFQFLRGKWSAEASEGIAEKMRNRLYEHLQAMSYDYHVKAETGDLIQRCTLDVDTIRRFLANQLIEIFRAVIMVISRAFADEPDSRKAHADFADSDSAAVYSGDVVFQMGAEAVYRVRRGGRQAFGDASGEFDRRARRSRIRTAEV